MSVYLFIVVATIVLGHMMPQQGYWRRWYIIIMAAIHTFVCGFRYMYLTGDLRNYASDYYNIVNYGWLSDEVINEGRNTGFYFLMKLFSQWTDGNFQIFLLFIAIVTEVVLAVLIYKYSPIPWCSYLVWNCITFYIFGFSAIKQALAMALVMWAFIFVLEEKPKRFLLLTLLAGTIHMPALVFVPAYWLAKIRITYNTILGYIFVGSAVYLFRSSLINIIGTIYYEDEMFVLSSNSLGGRFIMIAIIVLCGIVLKGFEERNFSKITHIIAIAAICQMLSGFDNIFTRLADYFFQMSVLYIPMLFSNYSLNTEIDNSGVKAFLPFNNRSLRVMLIIVSIVLVWYYYHYCLSVDIANEIDDYLNFRFMWDVIE